MLNQLSQFLYSPFVLLIKLEEFCFRACKSYMHSVSFAQTQSSGIHTGIAEDNEDRVIEQA